MTPPAEAPRETRMLATDAVTRGMAAMLPPDAPPLFTLLSARWIGKGAKREAVGRVTLYDGSPAVVAVGTHEMAGCIGLTHRWVQINGAHSLEDGRWVRVESNIVTEDAA